MGFALFWALIVFNFISSIKQFISRKFLEWPHLEKRPQKVIVFYLIFYYLSIIGLFISMLCVEDIKFHEIGIKLEVNPYVSFLIGFLINCAFQLVYRKKLKDFSIFESTKINYRTIRTFLPRKNRDKKILISGIVLLNPVYEELLYRGMLVFYLGLYLDNFLFSIILGYLVFISLHLYQGISVIYQHTLNYLFFILILFSPLGLIGAIGFHFGNDFFPFFFIKKIINNYVTKYRDSRKSILRVET